MPLIKTISPSVPAGRIIPLAGDQLSIGEILKTYEKVIGCKPWITPIPSFLAKRAMPKEFLDMFTLIREKGFRADIATIRHEYPQMMTFADWIRRSASRA